MTSHTDSFTRRHLDRRTFLAGASGTALAAVLAACTSSSSDEDAATTTPSAQGDSSTTTTTDADGDPSTPGQNNPSVDGIDRTALLQRLYLPMRDEVRIAVDVWLPAEAATQVVPTVLRTTRYGRSFLVESGLPADDQNADEANRWAERGYALVIVDARGSGASFGNRAEGELSDDEIQDYGEILTWLGSEAWSNGRVGAYGVSYDGNTAEHVARLGNPHLTAVAPQFSDYDPYRQLVYPGGVYLAAPFSQWLVFNDLLDGIDGSVEQAADLFGTTPEEISLFIAPPSPVDGPDGAALAEAARVEHQDNQRLIDEVPSRENIDDRWQPLAISTHRQAVEASKVPMLIQASWFDAGTAAGTLERFADFSNHQEVWIGPWSHGGERVLDATAIDPPLDFEDLSFGEQFGRVADFFDRYVRDDTSPPQDNVLRFTTVGATGWTETNAWPLPDVSDRTFYVGDGVLVDQRPATGEVLLPTGPHTSGETSRWAMNVSGDEANYSTWQGGTDARLSFSGSELTADLAIIGFPVVVVDVTGIEPDGVLYAYLEQVAADGTANYLTEGMLRLSHRGPSEPGDATAAGGEEPRTDRPVARSFLAADRQDVDAGANSTLTFDLFPISALVPAGSRLQLSFATSDVDNFADYGSPTAGASLLFGNENPTRLITPVRS